jgi:hypothetical protein
LCLEGEPLAHPKAAGAPEGAAQRGIAEQFADFVREGRGFARRHEEPVFAVGYGFGRSAHGGRNNRYAGRARLERHVRQAFGVRRQHDNVCAADEGIEVAAEARQHDAPPKAERRDLTFEYTAQRAFAEQHEAGGGVVATDRRGRFDQHAETLLRTEPPRADDDS